MNIEVIEQVIGEDVAQTVNARQLREQLGIRKDFSSWIKQQIGRGDFVEQVDYLVYTQKGKNLDGGRPTTEYILTLDAAKHITMMSQSKRGNEIRQYFIEVEKQWRKQQQGHPAQLYHLISATLVEPLKEQIMQLEKRLENIETGHARVIPMHRLEIRLNSLHRKMVKSAVIKRVPVMVEPYAFAGPEYRKEIYQEFWLKLSKHFGVESYVDIPACLFDEAMELIEIATVEWLNEDDPNVYQSKKKRSIASKNNEGKSRE